MLTTHTHKKLTWIDLENPTRDEVEKLMKEYDIHRLVAEELLGPTVRPKVDLYDNFIYLILHFPTISHSHNGETEQEIDFIIGKNFIITVHYEMVDPLHEFSKIFEVNSLLDKSNIGEHAGYIFFYIMREIYKNLGNELSTITNRLKDIEERIFKGEESKMVEEISNTNKSLLDFRESIRFHKEVLESFEAAGKRFFEEKFHYYLRALLGEYYKVYNQLENQKETLIDLRETNESLLTAKSNEIMKTLTVMAFMVLPVSLITQIFGMNTNLPIVGEQYDFEIVLGIMVAAIVFVYGFFRYKKWL
ncbi:MAG: CorA family divalent cation transporter [Patescibacteria group bacterium]|mgnify:CR=1 FL=1